MMTEKFFARVVNPIAALFLIHSFVFLGIAFAAAPGARAMQEKSSRGNDKFARPDAVTKAVRDRSKILRRVNVRREADSRELQKFGTIVADYGSYVLLATDAKTNLSKFDAAPVETTVHLPSGEFEPIQTPPAETVRPTDASRMEASTTGEKGYYVVQLAGTSRDEWLESLRETGAEILQYVPHQAFFVYADEAAAAKIVKHSRVRWVGRYAPEYKFSPALEKFAKESLRAAAAAEGGDARASAKFDVAVFSRADLEAVAARISAASSAKILKIIKLSNNFFNVLRVEVSADEIEAIAAIPDVVRIDPWVKPAREDERAAQIVAGNYTSPTSILAPGYNPLSQFGVNGSGVTVSVVDDGISIPGNGGFYLTSANTVNGPLRDATPGAFSGHGHINASIIAGDAPFGALDPLGYNYGIGIAPKAHLINIPYLKPDNTTTEAESIDDTLNTLGPNGVRGTISNNSWGDGLNGNAYDSLAAQYDGLVRDGSLDPTSIDPVTIIFSAGNSGASGLTRPKVAKNIIAVGSSENLRTEIGGSAANNIDDLFGNSSRGPSADGRIKPDIIAPGTVITGSRSANTDLPGGLIDANHVWSNGTSHAAPQVSGAAALFTHFWKNTRAGQVPSPSLIKAAIINTAQEMNGVVSNTASIPNGNEGWGRLNMKLMLNTGVPMKHFNQEYGFVSSGETYGLFGFVANSAKPTRVTLVWTDPPAVSDPALVNNLDLTVNVGGVEYKGNVFVNGSSAAGGSYDTKNNVENVFLPAGIPAGTPFAISVTATALNGDGIVGNVDATDQHFSLVAYNYTEEFIQPPPPAQTSKNADFDGDRLADVSVFRPSNGVWYVSRSSSNQVAGAQFGTAGDIIAPGDYDNDRKTDYAVFRPSSGTWFILPSNAGGWFTTVQFGQNGDVPTPGDYDGDGKHDISLYRPSNGVWYRLNSSNGQFVAGQFGAPGDLPVQGDFDGDRKTDVAVYRPSEGVWYLLRSEAGFAAFKFGVSGDKPAHADFDADGKTDAAVYRPSNGVWYIQASSQGFFGAQFGLANDIPAPADYDGDGKADITVYRPSEAVWYLLRSTQGFAAYQFGSNGDRPVANGYLPQ